MHCNNRVFGTDDKPTTPPWVQRLLVTLGLFAFFGTASCVIAGTGTAAKGDPGVCDTEAPATVESAIFFPRLQDGGTFSSDSDGKGFCILELTFHFEDSAYNRTLSALCKSCDEFYHDAQSQFMPVCFKSLTLSPSSGVYLSHGDSGASVTNKPKLQAEERRWELALLVCGSVAGGSIACMLLLCGLTLLIGSLQAYVCRICEKQAVVPLDSHGHLSTKV